MTNTKQGQIQYFQGGGGVRGGGGGAPRVPKARVL